ncbi:MAG: transcriptional repressor NrdR [Deltaproteobacteria bacterium]|nr:transcriptional repressor NrdR [Deltaproteobacteria bacterium]
MMCPYCQNPDTKVVDSRAAPDAVRRRRHCTSCGQRFTTYERLERRLPWVVKKDGSREPFSSDKVLRGIQLACRKRPVSADVQHEVLRRVEVELEGESEVPAREVGRHVLDALREADEVAWLRFASVYQEFETVEHFLQAIRGER